MDIKEKRKQYYQENKERIKQKNLEYYYENQHERIQYNREYWSTHKDKYLKERSEDRELKTKHRLYYQHYREKKSIQMKDLIVHNNNNKSFTVYFN